MQVKAQLKNLRIAPRKVRLAANLIKGLDVNEADIQLRNTVKRANLPIEKLLKYSIAIFHCQIMFREQNFVGRMFP